jgi:hypothetical protein
LNRVIAIDFNVRFERQSVNAKGAGKCPESQVLTEVKMVKFIGVPNIDWLAITEGEMGW